MSAANLGQLVALRVNDAALLWRWNLPTSEPYALRLSEGMLFTGPEGGILGVGLQGMSIDSYRDHLYALTSEDGTQRWDRPLDHAPGVLSAFGGSVYRLSPDALDTWQASNGMVRWHHPLRAVGLLVADGMIFAGTAGVVSDCFPGSRSQLVALQAIDGGQRWQFQAEAVSAAPAG